MPPSSAVKYFANEAHARRKAFATNLIIIFILLGVIFTIEYSYCIEDKTKYNGSCYAADCIYTSKTEFVNDTNCLFTYKLKHNITKYKGPNNIQDLNILDNCNTTLENNILCTVNISNNQAFITNKFVDSSKCEVIQNELCMPNFIAYMIFYNIALCIFILRTCRKNKEGTLFFMPPEKAIRIYYLTHIVDDEDPILENGHSHE